MHIHFPLNLKQYNSTEDASDDLKHILGSKYKSFVLLTGRTVSLQYSNKLLNKISVKPLRRIIIQDCSVRSVYQVEESLRSVTPACILAIGGGSVCDLAKRLCYLLNLPLVTVPTIIANDGMISPIAVLQDRGRSVSLPAKMPDDVLLDMSIILAAPSHFIISAACDLISNISATHDYEATLSEAGESSKSLSIQFARMAAFQVLNQHSWKLNNTIFTQSIIDGQILSGVAMALAGSSRPCSGSEHLLSHALDALELGKSELHGIKVGITSRFCLKLQNNLKKETDVFFDGLGIGRHFPGLEGASQNMVKKIFKVARTVRPGRVTVLDQYSDDELVRLYTEHIK
jgi:glycerol-1-phosphate dehydrogenase [NAD(P)+]